MGRKNKTMTTLEIFNTLRLLYEKYSYIKAWGLIEEQENGIFKLVEFNQDSYILCSGKDDSELIIQAFNEYECQVSQPGMYEFEALISYTEAQVGNYPPPNIEVPAYVEIEVVNFTQHEEKIKL